jgi:hypothetical protein
MENRSVQASDINQSVVVTGSGNVVSLRFGDTGIVLPLRRMQFPPPDRTLPGAPAGRSRLMRLIVMTLAAGPSRMRLCRNLG